MEHPCSIPFSEEDLSRCKKFAASCNDNYSTRNQNNSAVKARQVFMGKLGEIAAWTYVHPFCPSLTPPDFEIYKARQKSWKADIACGTVEFHVKTMGSDQAALYGLSWTFQFASANGKGGRDMSIFGSEDDSLIVFVEVDLKKQIGVIHSVIRSQRIHEANLFRDPKLDYLKGIKKCVYFDDLQAAGLIGATDHL